LGLIRLPDREHQMILQYKKLQKIISKCKKTKKKQEQKQNAIRHFDSGNDVVRGPDHMVNEG
jgi:dsRNA-specific ribonuclease